MVFVSMCVPARFGAGVLGFTNGEFISVALKKYANRYALVSLL